VNGGQTLSKDEVRRLLRECVTVVKPGETLVIRVGSGWTPDQMREMQDSLNWGWDSGTPYWPFRVLVVPGEELGVAQVPVASGHMHAGGYPVPEDLFAHMYRDHGMHMSGYGFDDTTETHAALHSHQHVAERPLASGAGGHE
jgi:hypothetical protein